MPRLCRLSLQSGKSCTSQSSAASCALGETKLLRVWRDRLVDVLRSVDPTLLLPRPNKLGDVKHFHSLAASAQEHGVAIGKLRGLINSGHYPQIQEATDEFTKLAKENDEMSGPLARWIWLHRTLSLRGVLMSAVWADTGRRILPGEHIVHANPCELRDAHNEAGANKKRVSVAARLMRGVVSMTGAHLRGTRPAGTGAPCARWLARPS